VVVGGWLVDVHAHDEAFCRVCVTHAWGRHQLPPEDPA